MISYKRNILITGGLGFIGSNLVRYFVNNYPDYLIINYDAVTYAGNFDNLSDIYGKSNYAFIKGDVRDFRRLNYVFNKYKITDVIHMCAESHVDNSMKNPTIFAETNVMGTINLLNAAKDYWKENYNEHVFINMGTDEIFGSLNENEEPFDENSPLNPHSPYSTSKASQIMFGRTYFEAYGLPIISIACGNAIGQNQYIEKLIPLSIDCILNDKKIPVYGKGLQMRDWTNVHDIVDAIDLLFHKGRIGELYCIGGDACKRNIDVIKALVRTIHKYVSNEEVYRFVEFIPDPRGKSHDFRYDINHDKITNELGWTPKHTFEDSINEVVQWYMDNQTWIDNIKKKITK